MGRVFLLGDGSTFLFCCPQQEPRERRVWERVGGDAGSGEVCQGSDCVAGQIVAFPRRPSRKVA